MGGIAGLVHTLAHATDPGAWRYDCTRPEPGDRVGDVRAHRRDRCGSTTRTRLAGAATGARGDRRLPGMVGLLRGPGVRLGAEAGRLHVRLRARGIRLVSAPRDAGGVVSP